MDPEELDVAHAAGINFPLNLVVVGPGGGVLNGGAVFGSVVWEEGGFGDGNENKSSEVFLSEDVEGLVPPGGGVLGSGAWGGSAEEDGLGGGGGQRIGSEADGERVVFLHGGPFDRVVGMGSIIGD